MKLNTHFAFMNMLMLILRIEFRFTEITLQIEKEKAILLNKNEKKSIRFIRSKNNKLKLFLL